MPDTTQTNFQNTLPRLLLRKLKCFTLYCIFWQQLTTERLCNKNINITQTTFYLVCLPQKRRCSFFSRAAALREATSEVEAIPVQKQSPSNTNYLCLTVPPSEISRRYVALWWERLWEMKEIKEMVHLQLRPHGPETDTSTAPCQPLPFLHRAAEHLPLIPPISAWPEVQ